MVAIHNTLLNTLAHSDWSNPDLAARLVLRIGPDAALFFLKSAVIESALRSQLLDPEYCEYARRHRKHPQLPCGIGYTAVLIHLNEQLSTEHSPFPPCIALPVYWQPHSQIGSSTPHSTIPRTLNSLSHRCQHAVQKAMPLNTDTNFILHLGIPNCDCSELEIYPDSGFANLAQALILADAGIAWHGKALASAVWTEDTGWSPVDGLHQKTTCARSYGIQALFIPPQQHPQDTLHQHLSQGLNILHGLSAFLQASAYQPNPLSDSAAQCLTYCNYISERSLRESYELEILSILQARFEKRQCLREIDALGILVSNFTTAALLIHACEPTQILLIITDHSQQIADTIQHYVHQQFPLCICITQAIDIHSPLAIEDAVTQFFCKAPCSTSYNAPYNTSRTNTQHPTGLNLMDVTGGTKSMTAHACAAALNTQVGICTIDTDKQGYQHISGSERLTLIRKPQQRHPSF